jgi:hypothetical protein
VPIGWQTWTGWLAQLRDAARWTFGGAARTGDWPSGPGPHRPLPEFFVGINLPWLSYGGDFGSNAWSPDGGVACGNARNRLADVFDRLVVQGIRHVRWFMLCDGRAGLRLEDDGRPAGLDEAFFRDADVALEVARTSGVRLLFVLLDFLWFAPGRIVNGVQTGGRRHLVADSLLRTALLDRVIAPILDRYGRDEAVFGWDLVNEPEWATLGVGTINSGQSVSPPAMRSYVAAAAELVHARTIHPATVGSASAQWLPLVCGLGLDFYQTHWYDRHESAAPLAHPVGQMGLDRPVILGEFPTRGSARTPSHILEVARTSGYRGVMAWSMLASDEYSDMAAVEPVLRRWAETHDGPRRA